MMLYIVRHTHVNVPQEICYGQSDVPLAASFTEESKAIVQKLSNIRFERTFSSPLSRCMELAVQLSGNIYTDDRLKELDFGEWEGKSWKEIFETEAGKKWFAEYLIEACPNGESYNNMLGRVRRFIDDLPDTGGKILIVTHAGVIRAFRILLENRPAEEAFNEPVAYGEITIVEKRS